jgi:hypothetical protein
LVTSLNSITCSGKQGTRNKKRLPPMGDSRLVSGEPEEAY